jgi:transposase
MAESTTELSKRLVIGHKRDGRSCYDKGAKQELIEACLRPGVSVARMALQHGINANLLRTWITRYRQRVGKPGGKASHPSTGVSSRAAFLPVVAAAAAVSSRIGVVAELPNGIRLDLSGVCDDDLASVLQLLSQLPCSGSTAV